MEIVNDSIFYLLPFDRINKLYFQMDYFLEGTEDKCVSAVVVKARKCEFGLLVLAKYLAVTNELSVAAFLSIMKEIFRIDLYEL